MNSKFVRCIALGILAALWQPATCRADLLFSTGPDILQYGNDGLLDVAAPNACLERFSLASDSTVQQITWSEWVSHGSTPTTVEWAITTDLVGGSGTWTGASDVVAEGTSALALTLTASGVQGNNDVYSSTFGVDVPLAAGTYYLWLGGAGDSTNDGSPGWGYANQVVGNAEQSQGGYLRVASGDFSVTIDGVRNSAVPEPTSLLSAASGILLLSFYVGRRRGRG